MQITCCSNEHRIVMEIQHDVNKWFVALQKALECCEHYGHLRRLFGLIDDDFA